MLFYTRAIPKILYLGLKKKKFVVVYVYVKLLLYVSCVRFELMKSPEVTTLCAVDGAVSLQ